MPESGKSRESYPVEELLEDLRLALRDQNRAVLEAQTGAGKSTIVPLALREEAWLGGRRILLLEPRRLAARAVAERMAELLGESVGENVGYRMHGETKVSGRSRIVVVTEGVLTRMLQADPALEEVGMVIFDEFHERSLHADLALALALQSQELFREDLRILLMSATLETQRISALFGEDTPRLCSAGRNYPVEIRYLPPREPRPLPREIAERTAEKILELLREERGSLLAFLPGAGEIRRVQRILEGRVGPEVILAPLYGAMDPSAQRRAIRPAPEGRRKVVLATNLAETSLTIEGIRLVLDSGWERGVRYDPGSGMDRYETRAISRQSATQRAGRAGRTEAGVCLRLWHAGRGLPPARVPEILASDLSLFSLELAAWGAQASELHWLDPPPASALEEARRLLLGLDMLTQEGSITAQGRRALALGLSPRLAHMLLEARASGYGYEAAVLALYWQERPFKPRGPDLREILAETARRCANEPRLRRELDRLLRRADLSKKEAPDFSCAGYLTALAYPERIARRRERGATFLTASGKGVRLVDDETMAKAEWLAVARIAGSEAEGKIFEAAPIEGEELSTLFAAQIGEREIVRWDEEKKRVEARRVRSLGAIILESLPLETPDDTLILSALLEGIRREGLGMLPWDRRSRSLLERLRFAHCHLPDEFPDWSEEKMLEDLQRWLLPYLAGRRSLSDLRELDMVRILESETGWEALQRLEGCAPERITVPSGSRIAVDYRDPQRPILAAKLQELFGWECTPMLIEGRVPLTIHLLSPAGRPLQITRDLAHFWEAVYPEVRREMRGRYPKHPWPEDPLSAQATKRTKKQLARR